jgi:hypothetical protein
MESRVGFVTSALRDLYIKVSVYSLSSTFLTSHCLSDTSIPR